jgi:hypothetical protein
MLSPKDVILFIMDDKKLRNTLIEIYRGRECFNDEYLMISERNFDFFDSAGMVVQKYEGAIFHYELNDYGKKIAEIVLDLESLNISQNEVK